MRYLESNISGSIFQEFGPFKIINSNEYCLQGMVLLKPVLSNQGSEFDFSDAFAKPLDIGEIKPSDPKEEQKNKKVAKKD